MSEVLGRRIRGTRLVHATAGSRRRGDFVASRSYVRKTVNRGKETDYFDKDIATEQMGTDNAPSLLSLIPQGDGAQQRLGDKIKPVSLQIRGRINQPDAVNNTYARIVVIQWHSNTGAETPTLATLFENGSAKPIEDHYIGSKGDRAKFKVLLDRTFTLETVAEKSSRYINWTISGKKIAQIRFTDADTTAKNHIYMYLLGQDTVAGAGGPVADIVTRLRFKN